MGERTSHTPGTFSWVDLSTSDPVDAKRFYGGLLGWTHNDLPVGDGIVYTMCQIDGKNVCAISGQAEQERSQGIPPHWNNYVTVEDVDASTAKAKELGGERDRGALRRDRRGTHVGDRRSDRRIPLAVGAPRPASAPSW